LLQIITHGLGLGEIIWQAINIGDNIKKNLKELCESEDRI